jgi:general secretion pathway protein C
VTEARAPSLVIGAVALSEYGRRHLNAQPELLLDRPLSSRTALSLLRQARRLLNHIDRYPGLYLPRAAGVALAVLIAYQCATLYGVIVTPLDGPPRQAARPPQLQPATLLATFDPFFSAAASAPAAIAATDLMLHGLRQDRRTGGGSAIISQSDGAQRSFGIGEEIAPGIALKQVGSDHVIIARHGLDERLAFKEFAPTGSAATPAMRSVPSPYAPTPAASPAVEVRQKQPAPRGPTLPARSIDFADPSTLPTSLTTPKR